MTWTEWVLIGLMIFAAVDICASFITALCAEKETQENK